eukprot:CAMPEP_0114350306 /NCGR_PEP_ID=MMETSP0101-20121206/16256_1 /TAXON_ID=38822 ORGANISM="Pteridomonas danica, Strain PT" /NCGR_SAMPLE_ID=MMETSP0101 /ASSEMBLY_ACC=CAM_ASM_000211 /LENGTH=72 /DNA_ID=CAMNT_0001489459 /DNA_START=59 /DNA_END=278 /DNA_ORIENTATION=-
MTFFSANVGTLTLINVVFLGFPVVLHLSVLFLDNVRCRILLENDVGGDGDDDGGSDDVGGSGKEICDEGKVG